MATSGGLIMEFGQKQLQIFDYRKFRMPVHIIGAGGMGSAIATSLIRMGLGQEYNPITLHDHDHFESHNLANQYVTADQVGTLKVRAVRDNMLMINPEAKIIDRPYAVAINSKLSGFVFVCIDSMDSRGEIMEEVLEGNTGVKGVIETRMDAVVGISHCFNPNIQRHCDCWWEQFYADDETENMAGCGGFVSIISAIHGTTMLALKQFERFARLNRAHGQPNRIYQDFENGITQEVIWSVSDNWD